MGKEKETPIASNSVDLGKIWQLRKWLAEHSFTEDDVLEFLDNQSFLSDNEKRLAEDFELMLETSRQSSVDRVCKPEELTRLDYIVIQYSFEPNQN